jgi:succinate dehydrogenase/fumarate reductase-like Fe-S protein
MLILITIRKSLPLVSDKVRPHFRQVLNIRQVLINIRQVPNIILIQQLVVDFHRYIQRVRDVSHQHPTQASRNPRSNPELTREERELPQLMMHLGGAITNIL